MGVMQSILAKLFEMHENKLKIKFWVRIMALMKKFSSYTDVPVTPSSFQAEQQRNKRDTNTRNFTGEDTGIKHL